MVKREFRKKSLHTLRKIAPFQRYSLDKKIGQNIEKLIDRLNPSSILFYLPLQIEVDLRGVMKRQRFRGRKILVPKIEKQSFKMVEYRLPLEENSFKIFEPKSSNLKYKKVDLLIVPVVGMDKNGQRIGFGKGMYDRFFDSLKHKPIVIFVQRVPLISKQNLCETYDIKCDYYISSKEFKKLGRTR